MVTVDWLSRILERSLGTRSVQEASVGSPRPVPVSRERPLSSRRQAVLECPHCHSRITDFDIETG